MIFGTKLSGPVLAVASPGGHWLQLRRVESAWEGAEVVYLTPRSSDLKATGQPGHLIPDASRSNPLGVLRLIFEVLRVLLRTRPSLIVSTGAAPGLIAVALGKLLGIKTVWIDSIANIKKLSMSGRLAGHFADVWLTQWPHLAKPEGPEYAGGVL